MLEKKIEKNDTSGDSLAEYVQVTVRVQKQVSGKREREDTRACENWENTNACSEGALSRGSGLADLKRRRRGVANGSTKDINDFEYTNII